MIILTIALSSYCQCFRQGGYCYFTTFKSKNAEKKSIKIYFAALSEEKTSERFQVLHHSIVETTELREKRGFFVVNFGKLLAFKEKMLYFSKAK